MQQEVPGMPNRTIYVADSDVSLFERAQTLAGGNLSAAIAEAIRRFVEAREKKVSGFEEITVEVGKLVHTHKRFQGRLLARAHIFEENEMRQLSYSVYLTPKGNLVVYSRNTPNWNYWSRGRRKQRNWSHEDWKKQDWSQWSNEDWKKKDWSQWSNEESGYRLEVYGSLEDLEHNIPHELRELYEAVSQAVHGAPDSVEDLDI